MKRGEPSDSVDLGSQRILVTGGLGFVGRHLVARLAQRGAEVITASRSRAHSSAIRHEGLDLRDAASCDRVVAAVQPHIIYHLAGTKSRSDDISLLREAYETNVFGPANLFMSAARQPALKTIVVIGSSEEYGRTESTNTEQTREAPISVYSLVKTSLTHVAQFLNRVYGIPCVIIRPTVVYGPGQPADMFIPALIQALIQGRIFPMTAGEQTRDFVYVSDVVDALERAAACHEGELLNVGSGVETRIVDLARQVGQMLGRGDLAHVGALEYRNAEVMRHRIDISRAAGKLGWRPRVSLDEGLLLTIAAYRGATLSA